MALREDKRTPDSAIRLDSGMARRVVDRTAVRLVDGSVVDPQFGKELCHFVRHAICQVGVFRWIFEDMGGGGSAGTAK